MIEVREISKTFDGQPVLQDVSLLAREGEIVALLGPSGCGKTTLLRIIAGLETLDAGQVLLNRADISTMPTHKRGFGMVFQDYALFPHRNVNQNVAFGLRMLNAKQALVKQRVEQVLGLVGLAEFAERAVHELSGGEQQRVALARALAPWPRVLLLDEPLGSLDRALRERLMGDLRSILKRASESMGSVLTPSSVAAPETSTTHGSVASSAVMTSIYVTHDQEEAFAIADRVVVMNEGRVEQAGAPVELYRQPETAFVARFLGMDNLLPAEVLGDDPPSIRSTLGDLQVSEVGAIDSGPMTVLIRPEAAEVVSEGEVGANTLEGRIVNISFRGRHQVAIIEFAGTRKPIFLKFNFDSEKLLPVVPSPIHVRLKPAQVRLLKP